MELMLLISLLVAINMCLLLVNKTLYSVFMLTMVNSITGISMIILKNFSFMAGLVFLVFMGGLLVLFFYLVSLNSKVPAMKLKFFSMIMLMPVMEFTMVKVYNPKALTLLDHNTFLLSEFSKLWGMSGLLMVLAVMFIINNLLSESSFSIRNIY